MANTIDCVRPEGERPARSRFFTAASRASLELSRKRHRTHLVEAIAFDRMPTRDWRIGATDGRGVAAENRSHAGEQAPTPYPVLPRYGMPSS